MLRMSFKDYRITTDDRQFILQKVVRKDDGEISMLASGGESTRMLGYFGFSRISTLLQAIEEDMIFNTAPDLQSLSDLALRVQEVMQPLQELNREIEKALEGKK